MPGWLVHCFKSSWSELHLPDCHVYLLIDNCPANSINGELLHIVLKFLPSNTISVVQPLGIIKNFKATPTLVCMGGSVHLLILTHNFEHYMFRGGGKSKLHSLIHFILLRSPGPLLSPRLFTTASVRKICIPHRQCWIGGHRCAGWHCCSR